MSASTSLLLIILVSSLLGKDVAVLASLGIVLVNKGDLGKGADDVLHLGVVVGAVLATKVVQPLDLVEEVVDDGDDNGDTNRVTPDDNDSDNVSPSVTTLVPVVTWVSDNWVTGHPTEDTEDGGKSIDGEDGGDKSEGWNSLATTGDEDEPVLSEGDFEEEDFLNGTEVLDNTTGWQEHGSTDDPGTDGKQDTEDDGDEPDLWKLPLDWTLLGVGVVVSNGDGGQIGEEGDEDNQVTADDLVDDNGGEGKVNFQVKTEGDTVLDVGLHTLENLTSGLDGKNDGGETRGEEDDIGGGLGSLGGTLDGNTTVRLLERWSIVDT